MKLSTRALSSYKKLAVVAALAAACGSASALTTTSTGAAGLMSTTFSSGSSFVFDGFLQVLSGSLTSFTLSGPSGTYSTSTASFPGIYTLSPGVTLAGGSYTLTTSAPSYNLSYSVTPVTAPVPEPETYALFFAGLGAIGFLTRRRNNG